jgi:AraC family transcriptional regulator
MTTTKKSILAITKKVHFGSYENLLFENVDLSFRPLNESLENVNLLKSDIVIIDCDSDIGLGFDILKAVKATHPGTPVIFITSQSSENSVIKAYRAGAREYFKSPPNMLELKSAIEGLLKLKEASREIRSPFCLSGEFGDASDETTSTLPPNILRAVCQVLDNFHKKLTLDELAGAAGMSKFHFCRAFNRHCGMSPMKFVSHIRIQRSLDLLKRKEMSISMIADAVGYRDPGNFIRHFKRLIGSTPSAYRNTSDNKTRPAGLK